MSKQKWKIRASSIGKLMTKPKNKDEVLSEFAKSYLIEVYTGYKDFETNKYTNKGWATEDKIIDMIDKVFECGGLSKNENYYENDYFTGTPDILHNGYVFDAKSSWSINTLYNHATKGEEEIYKYQLLAYMDLLGYNKGGYIFRGLVNTPENKYQKEVVWEDMPFNKRWICFKVNYCKETIDKMKLQVERANAFLKEYDKMISLKIGNINDFY